MSKPYVPYGTKRYRDRDREQAIDHFANEHHNILNNANLVGTL